MASAGTVVAIAGAGRTLGQAIDAFLAQPPRPNHPPHLRPHPRAPGRAARPGPAPSRRHRRGTRRGRRAAMGPQKPRTWNRQVATVRSFLSWCRRHGWPVGGLALRVDRRAVDVDDLDLANRQAKARTKGGYVRQLNFQTAAARLLAKLVAGRERGPVFLTGRRPGPRHRPGAAELRDGRAALQALLRRAARCTSSAIPA